MTPEDCLTPSQEATAAQRALLEAEEKLRRCEHALNSERWFRKKDKEELALLDSTRLALQAEEHVHHRDSKYLLEVLDCALERVAELEAKGTVEEPKSEGRFPAKAYGGSS